MRLELFRKRHKTSTSARDSHFHSKADTCSCVQYKQHKIKLVKQMTFKMWSCNNQSVVSSGDIQSKVSYRISNCSVLLDRPWIWAKETVTGVVLRRWVYCYICECTTCGNINTVGECTAIHLSVPAVGPLIAHHFHFIITSRRTIHCLSARAQFSHAAVIDTTIDTTDPHSSLSRLPGSWHSLGHDLAVTDYRCTTLMGVCLIKTHCANDWSLKRVQKYEDGIYSIVRWPALWTRHRRTRNTEHIKHNKAVLQPVPAHFRQIQPFLSEV
jgi:hypothetical protein